MSKIKIRQLLNTKTNFLQASWLGIGNSFGAIISILLMVVISRFLEKSEYGSFRQVMYIYATIISVVGLSLSKLPSNYLPLLSLPQGKNLINKTMLLLTVLAGLFCALIYFGNPLLCDFFNNSELRVPLTIFSLVVLFTVPTLIIEGIYASYKNTQTLGLYLVINKTLLLLFLIAPLVFGSLSLASIMASWALHAFITLLLGVYLIYKPFFKVIAKDCLISFSTIYSFLVPLTLSSLLGILFTASDQYYISNYFGKETYADFSNGSIQIPFIGILVGSISAVLHPYFIQKLNTLGGTEEVVKTIKSSLLKSMTLVYPVIIFIWFSSDEIFSLLFEITYSNSSNFFEIISLFQLFSIFVFLPIIIALQEIRFYNLVHIFAAGAVWGIQLLALNITDNALVVPLVSLLVKIGIITLLLYKIMRRLKVALFDLIPLKAIVQLALTCVSILLPFEFLKGYLQMVAWQTLLYLILVFILYYFLILIIDKSFRLRLVQIFKQFV